MADDVKADNVVTECDDIIGDITEPLQKEGSTGHHMFTAQVLQSVFLLQVTRTQS
ncbi:hypothetical protein NQZ68_000734 [Dissostichus eleginoides]|nr:hypothetical protein NQZ68_000734 [Dissostichus eleginoides]